MIRILLFDCVKRQKKSTGSKGFCQTTKLGLNRRECLCHPDSTAAQVGQRQPFNMFQNTFYPYIYHALAAATGRKRDIYIYIYIGSCEMKPHHVRLHKKSSYFTPVFPL